MNTKKFKTDLSDLADLINPWFIFLVTSVCFSFYCMMEIADGRLSLAQHALGYLFTIIALFVAHSYRSAYKSSEQGKKYLYDLIDDLLGGKKDDPGTQGPK